LRAVIFEKYSLLRMSRCMNYEVYFIVLEKPGVYVLLAKDKD
jgi:hypothetical protein